MLQDEELFVSAYPAGTNEDDMAADHTSDEGRCDDCDCVCVCNCDSCNCQCR